MNEQGRKSQSIQWAGMVDLQQFLAIDQESNGDSLADCLKSKRPAVGEVLLRLHQPATSTKDATIQVELVSSTFEAKEVR